VPRSSRPALQEIIAVLGCPAAGIPTQYVFERAMAAAGLDWRFVTFDVPLERAEDAIRGVRALGFRGAVLTGPLRQSGLPLVDSASPTAAFAGVVSMIDRQPEGLVGHMTDGRAAVEAIRGHFDPVGAAVLLIGSGPAAAATALELSLAGVGRLLLANRSTDRSTTLAERLRGIGGDRTPDATSAPDAPPAPDAAPAAVMAVEAIPCERGKPLAIPEEVGLVVSAIPAADKTVIELDAVRPDLVMADIVLGGEPSALGAQGVRHGACTVDVIEIRCARTAIEFVQWTGLEPNADLLREALEEFGCSRPADIGVSPTCIP